jgi:succinoglycan biosynthesis protein ExoH
MTELPRDQSSLISKRISILRLVLIAGVVVIHIPFDDSSSPYNHGASLFNWLRVLFGEVIFRSAVPCLSAISGYLLFRNGRLGCYITLIKRKFTTLFVPFIIFNTGLYVLVFTAQQHDIAVGYFPDLQSLSTSDSLNLMFSYSAHPINLPLYFLRDLFVCIILAPLIELLVLKVPIITLTAIFTMTMVPWHWYLLLRVDILFAFTVGATLSLHEINICILDKIRGILFLLFLLASSAFAYILLVSVDHEARTLVLGRKLLLILGVGCIWSFGSSIVNNPFGDFLFRHSRASFWLFCTHYPMLIVCWMFWNKYALPSYYPVFYFASLIIAVLCLGSVDD